MEIRKIHSERVKMNNFAFLLLRALMLLNFYSIGMDYKHVSISRIPPWNKNRRSCVKDFHYSLWNESLLLLHTRNHLWHMFVTVIVLCDVFYICANFGPKMPTQFRTIHPFSKKPINCIIFNFLEPHFIAYVYDVSIMSA